MELSTGKIRLVLNENTDDVTIQAGDALWNLALVSTFANGLCQLYLLVNGDKRLTTYFHKVFVECFTGSVGDTFLNL